MARGHRSRVGFGRLAVATLAGSTALLATGGAARAQEGTLTPAAQPPPPPPPRVVEPARASDETPAREEPTDHERVVGRFGITYFDVANLPIANQFNGGGTPAPGQITSSTVQAPVIGARYWLNRRIGIDAGIGLGFAGGSTEAVAGSTDTTVNKTGTNGFAFHAAVPLALAEGKHYAFLIIPGATLGFTTATFKPVSAGGVTPPDQDLSGFLFDIGARAGAEIYFGFIGIPQLALQATVGLSYRRSTFKWSSNGNSASDGTNTFGTNVQADPWSIFKDAVSATYYF